MNERLANFLGWSKGTASLPCQGTLWYKKGEIITTVWCTVCDDQPGFNLENGLMEMHTCLETLRKCPDVTANLHVRYETQHTCEIRYQDNTFGHASSNDLAEAVLLATSKYLEKISA